MNRCSDPARSGEAAALVRVRFCPSATLGVYTVCTGEGTDAISTRSSGKFGQAWEPRLCQRVNVRSVPSHGESHLLKEMSVLRGP